MNSWWQMKSRWWFDGDDDQEDDCDHVNRDYGTGEYATIIMIRDWAVWWCLGGDGGENWGLRISKFNDHDDEISDDLRFLSLQVDSIHGEIGDVLYQFQSVLTTTMTSVMTMRVMGSRPESLVLASREPLTDWRHKGANPTSLKTQRWRHTTRWRQLQNHSTTQK